MMLFRKTWWLSLLVVLVLMWTVTHKLGLDGATSTVGERDSTGSESRAMLDDTDVATKPSWAQVQVQSQRRRLVAEACESNPNLDLTIEGVLARKQPNIFVSDSHKVVYCSIPKVSCSTWRSFFLKLHGATDYTHGEHDYGNLKKHGLKLLHKYSPSNVTRILRDYKKFVVVRHPYIRLHSAFMQKLANLKDPQFAPNYGVRIIKRYWKNPSPQNLATGQNITFEDFVRYITDPDVPFAEGNQEHWATYKYICEPCLIKYDYILKMETMAEESEPLLREVIGTNLTLGMRNVNPAHHEDMSPYDAIPRELMDRLWGKFGMDFKLFGYSLEG